MSFCLVVEGLHIVIVYTVSFVINYISSFGLRPLHNLGGAFLLQPLQPLGLTPGELLWHLVRGRIALELDDRAIEGPHAELGPQIITE